MAADLLPFPCPFCGDARKPDVSRSDMIEGRIVTGVDEQNGPVYFAECQQCGAQGPVESFAVDALDAWSRRAQPLAAPATTTGVPLPDPSDAMVDDWKCPRCGSDQTWFDRTEPMATRCSNCGRDVNAGDDITATIGVECVSNGDATIDYAASGIATPPAAPAAVTEERIFQMIRSADPAWGNENDDWQRKAAHTIAAALAAAPGVTATLRDALVAILALPVHREDTLDATEVRDIARAALPAAASAGMGEA